jgi:hypothetical protein
VTSRGALTGIAVGLGVLLALTTDAPAAMGRPLTPLSYAGAARRTTRRAEPGAAAGTNIGCAGGGTALRALPPGCRPGAPCRGTVYRPVYEGATLVYIPE